MYGVWCLKDMLVSLNPCLTVEVTWQLLSDTVGQNMHAWVAPHKTQMISGQSWQVFILADDVDLAMYF